jgi:hypothetical protein
LASARQDRAEILSPLDEAVAVFCPVFIFVICYCYRQYANLFSIPTLYTVRKIAVQEKSCKEEAQGTRAQERKKKSQTRTIRTNSLRGARVVCRSLTSVACPLAYEVPFRFSKSVRFERSTQLVCTVESVLPVLFRGKEFCEFFL